MNELLDLVTFSDSHERKALDRVVMDLNILTDIVEHFFYNDGASETALSWNFRSYPAELSHRWCEESGGENFCVRYSSYDGTINVMDEAGSWSIVFRYFQWSDSNYDDSDVDWFGTPLIECYRGDLKTLRQQLLLMKLRAP